MELTLETLETWIRDTLSARDAATETKLKSLVASAVADTGATVAQLAKRFDDLDAALRRDPTVKAFGEQLEKRAGSIADAIGEEYGVGGVTEQKLADYGEKFDLSKAIVGHLKRWPKHLQRQWPGEFLLTSMATEKAQQAEVDTAGGFAVPSVHLSNAIIPALEAQSIASLLGATTEDGFAGSPVDIPRFDSTPDAQWVGEIESADDQSFNMGNVRMTPHGLVSLIPLSNRLLRMAPNLRNPIQGMMVRSLSRKLDLAVLKGTGAGGSPVGMTNTGGIGSESWSGFEPGDPSNLQNVTTLLENMIGDLEDANAFEGRIGWAMSPAVRRALLRAKGTDGYPVFFNSRVRGAGTPEAGGGIGRGPLRGEFYGFPYATSTQLAGGTAGDLILANWETVMIGFFQTIVIEASREAGDAFRKNQTYLKAYTEADVGIMHPEAICVANSFNTTVT
jgi:HK97 family phage major capsid protein